MNYLLRYALSECIRASKKLLQHCQYFTYFSSGERYACCVAAVDKRSKTAQAETENCLTLQQLAALHAG